jgi:hypothetical protein
MYNATFMQVHSKAQSAYLERTHQQEVQALREVDLTARSSSVCTAGYTPSALTRSPHRSASPCLPLLHAGRRRDTATIWEAFWQRSWIGSEHSHLP